MRKLILFTLLATVAFAQIPSDTLKTKVAERKNAYTRFRDAHPGAQIVKRVEQAIHFKMPDGSYTAILGQNLSYVDPDTRDLTPVDVSLYKTDAGYRTTGSPITVRVVDGPMLNNNPTSEIDTYYKDPNTGTVTGYGIVTAPVTLDHDTVFTFQQGGLPWTIELQDLGWDLRATVASSQGAKTYRFGYREVNMTLDPDAGGNLATANGAYKITAPVMVRADGMSTPCGGWQKNAAGNIISFTCDDSAFPAAAYPYVIDPNMNYWGSSGSDDGYLYGQSYSWPPASVMNYFSTATENKIGSSKDAGGMMYDYITVTRWDTSSIPASATISSASLLFYETTNSNISTTGINLSVDYCPSCTFPVGSSDWNTSFSGSAYSGTMDSLKGMNGNFTLTLQNPNSNIVKGGYTAFKLGSTTQPTTIGSNILSVYSFDQSTSYAQLNVSYTVGGPKLIVVEQ